MPKLAYTDAEGASAERVVRAEPVTIGRGAECDIRLADADVGRLHAVVEPSEGKLRVRDQESRSGTWVNGERVAEALLGDGDEFRVGGVSFKVGLGGASSRRSGGEGDGGEGAEGAGSRRVSRRPQREILGGIRLSKTQQLIIKIVCAAVILFCIAVIIKMLTYMQNRPVEYINRVTYVDQEAEPKRLAEEARTLAQSAREAEQAGRTQEAYDLIKKARDSVDQACALMDALVEKYQGPTYWKLHNSAAEINQRASAIRNQAMILEMQIEREKAGGD